MIGSMLNGISGITTYEKAINIESNDASNVNTVGHKGSDIRFEDMAYNSSNGSGVAVQSINKSFTQGNIVLTDYNYDVAISGDGFFVVNDPVDDETYYTRAGNFKMGPEGNLLGADDLQIMGVVPEAYKTIGTGGETYFTDEFSEFLGSTNINSDVSTSSINAKATDYSSTVADEGISGAGFKEKATLSADISLLKTAYQNALNLYSTNINATSTAPVSQVLELDFSSLKASLTGSGTSVSVVIDNQKVFQNFETDADTTMNLFSDKISKIAGLTSSVDTTGKVNITTVVPGESFSITSPNLNSIFINEEILVEAQDGSGLEDLNAKRDALQANIERAGGKFLEMTNSVSLVNEQNLSMQTIQLRLDNLNISTNPFATLEVDNGALYMKDGDNKFLIGKLATVRFADNTGLAPEGNNNYSKTDTSGEARYSADTSTIVSNSLERSNTDLGDNLVELMVLQRAFEANSKSITTSDEFLKTAIALKR